jgi:hypothetical protein
MRVRILFLTMAADCLDVTLMASDGCTVLATRAKTRNGATMILENDMFKKGDGELRRFGWLRLLGIMDDWIDR